LSRRLGLGLEQVGITASPVRHKKEQNKAIGPESVIKAVSLMWTRVIYGRDIHGCTRYRRRILLTRRATPSDGIEDDPG
jgi:hypothetical protein